jgi:hypothetical protein
VGRLGVVLQLVVLAMLVGACPASTPTHESATQAAPPAPPETPPNPEWLATRKKRPPEPPELYGDQGGFALAAVPLTTTDPREFEIRAGRSVDKEVARKIIHQVLHCFCDHASELVDAVPRSMHIDVDGPTQKARPITLTWTNGETTTQGPISDCFNRELATKTFAFDKRKDSTIDYPFLHLSCVPVDPP